MNVGLHPLERKIVESQRSSSKDFRAKKHIRTSSQPATTFRDVAGTGPNATSRPAVGPEVSAIPKASEEKIEELEKLSIGPTSTDAMPLPTSNPLKRGPTDGPETLHKESIGQSAGSTTRRGKSLSVGPFIVKEPVDARDSPMIDVDYPATDYGSLRRLDSPSMHSPKPFSRDPLEAPAGHGPSPFQSVSPDGRVVKPGIFPRAILGLDPPLNPNAKGTGRPGSAPTDRPVSSTKQELEYQGDRPQPIGPHQDVIQEADPQIIRQPETRPISHDQLVIEVKGIYAGLVLVEQKCKEVDEKQSAAALERDPARRAPLSNEQWQALIALHKTLLHEHHDFFLASQHPSASPTLSKLAAKYCMPARMWRHGIHAFLEVLRHRLPASSDHMLAFIYIAYSMMALLYETVSAFEETWIECLGDLARYRMAIEEHDVQDREIWGGVARFWYSKAADKHPETGRLYHHLAILARPNSLQQLAFYSRSLASVSTFQSARSSIMTLFQPMLQGKVASQHRLRAFEVAFIKIHANLFVHGQPTEEVERYFQDIQGGLLAEYIGRVTTRFRDQGASIAFTNIAALCEYGAVGPNQKSKSVFRLYILEVWVQKLKDREVATGKMESALDVDEDKQKSHLESLEKEVAQVATEKPIVASLDFVGFVSKFTFTVLALVLQHPGDKNVYPFAHIMFCFIWTLTSVEKLTQLVEHDIPWKDICSFLNALAKPDTMTFEIWAEELPIPDQGVTQPLPEDFALRGQLCALWYHPEKWFDKIHIDLEERSLEMPSMAASRVERILWLGMGIASHERWIVFDQASLKFQLKA